MSGALVAEIAWPEVEARLAQGSWAVLPIGAAAKEHGRHMPMGTDYQQAQWLGRELARRAAVLVWPPVGYGYYPAFVDFPGSCSLSAETFEQVVQDLVGCLLSFGAARVLILNTGISTIPPAERAVEHCGDPRRVTLANVYRGPRYLEALKAVQEQRRGTHADEAETSIMLAIAPEQVDMDRAERRDDRSKQAGPFQRRDPEAPNYTPSGVWGDATLADPDKGALLLEAMMEDLLAVIDAREA